jgi:hypothetical protein
MDDLMADPTAEMSVYYLVDPSAVGLDAAMAVPWADPMGS